MSDLISRADAIEAVAKLCVDGYKAKVDGHFIPLTDALINTLSALPTADTVSREDYHNLLTATEDIDRALREYQAKDEIPSADAKHDHGDGQWYDLTDALTVERNEWIPCSERLPSESGNYLITVADLRLGHNGEHTVTMADFYAKAKKWNSIVDVYAWMPLPPSYRGE